MADAARLDPPLVSGPAMHRKSSLRIAMTKNFLA